MKVASDHDCLRAAIFLLTLPVWEALVTPPTLCSVCLCSLVCVFSRCKEQLVLFCALSFSPWRTSISFQIQGLEIHVPFQNILNASNIYSNLIFFHDFFPFNKNLPSIVFYIIFFHITIHTLNLENLEKAIFIVRCTCLLQRWERGYAVCFRAAGITLQ